MFQDVWAILVPGRAADAAAIPSVWRSLESALQGALLVAASLAGEPVRAAAALFAFIAKVPELLLVTALAWCFLVSGAASWLGLSREMGALIAGVGMSTFPYNLDVIAKVVNIRDFFVTLFFVALGMRIPVPTAQTLAAAVAASACSWCSAALVSVFPVLYASAERPADEPAALHQPGADERVLAGDRFARAVAGARGRADGGACSPSSSR